MIHRMRFMSQTYVRSGRAEVITSPAEPIGSRDARPLDAVNQEVNLHYYVVGKTYI